MSSQESQQTTGGHRRFSAWFIVAQVLAYVTALTITVPVEIARFREARDAELGPAGWFVGVNVDTTPFFLLLVVAPLCWWSRRALRIEGWWGSGRSRRVGRRNEESQAGKSSPDARAGSLRYDSRAGSLRRVWLLALVVGLVSVAMSAAVAGMRLDQPGAPRFGDLPPAYHDEYSYLFQAKTFLAGRLWFPSHPDVPRLFDQMHVLNEGRFASRYFPATGAWIAPFLEMGRPYWGHWLAGALTAVFVFGIGRELEGNGVGLLAGLLTALSPGMALFSNLLLSHHPTLVGLTLFIYAFLRMMRTKHWADALLAGGGLAFAMLARPMTAAGVGLPFGIWFAWWLLHRSVGVQPASRSVGFQPASGERPMAHTPRSQRWKLAAVMGVPLLCGFTLLFFYNRAITGSGWKTPYQVYTETYTPRHVYGFNNVIRGERRIGPKVLENYDRWAENLTPALAAENTRVRLIASWQWTLGIVPLAMATVVFLFAVGRSWFARSSPYSEDGESSDPERFDGRWWLVPAAILSLHAVHVPYWYEGIMHWHYVFESGPLWLLVFAGATRVVWTGWRACDRPWMPLWWSAVIAAALATTYLPADPLWSSPRIRVAVENIAFSRRKHAAFHQMIDRFIPPEQRPALVLVTPHPDDLHIDYVTNAPDLQGDVLFARYRPSEVSLEEAVHAFPDRACYLFDAKEGRLALVRAKSS